MTTNNKISNLISSQLPSFVRDDHENFVKFLEAYYEWMEQSNQPIDKIKNIKDYFDVDKSVDGFIDELYKTYLNKIPAEVIADKALLLKHIKDFYRARGTEKSISFLLRVLFGPEAETTGFYYPKADILRASDGKWFIEKSLKFNDAKIDGVSNTNLAAIKYAFEKSKITGNTSTASAIVERMDTYYDAATLVNELKLSNQSKDFVSGEVIFALYEGEDGNTHTISANIFSGIINKVSIIQPGTGYVTGTTIPIESNTGTGGIIQITSVSTGNIKSVYVLDGGAGFQNNNLILFAGGDGSGANANVSAVLDDSSVHPNSYNIVISLISSEQNTALNNVVFSNLNSSNVNTTISDAMTYFVYGNTGPIKLITILNPGNNYTGTPTLSVSANTRVRELGILGKMKIIDGGLNYVINDKIEFLNIFGGYGVGASGNVTNVAANGKITEVQFVPVSGFITGGSGYDQNFLPNANVISGTGNGANIVVTACLGYGENLSPVSDSLGAIQTLSIVSGGSGYETPPKLNLVSFGDGTAQVNASIVAGSFKYPGRYLNDDGHLSGYNFLEDRDYYQTFSYVVRLNKSIEKYRKYLKDLLHPAGLKLFGEYLNIDTSNNQLVFQSTNTSSMVLKKATYSSTTNTNTSNLTITTNVYSFAINTSNLTITANIVSANLNTSNLTISTNVTSANINTSNLTLTTYAPTTVNTSNLTLSTGSGASVNLINLSAWSGNSNVYFTIGYTLNVKNSNVTIQGYNATTNTINVTPGVAGNIVANTLYVYESYTPKTNLITLSAWSGNSNVFFSNGFTLNVFNSNVIVTSYNATTNTVNVTPAVSANLITNVLKIYEPYYPNTNTINISAWAGNSNIFFNVGYTLNVQNSNVTVTSYNAKTNTITVSPAVAGNLTANVLKIYVPYYLKSNTINLSGWSGNSNIFFNVGYTLNIRNSNVIVTSYNANTNSINVSPWVTTNIVNETLFVYSPYPVTQNTINLSAWAGNSNVAFAIGRRINVKGSIVTITDYNANSAFINVTPAVSGTIIANTLIIYGNTSNIKISTTANTSNLSNVYIEFVDATNNNMPNLSNGIYKAYANNTGYLSFFIETANLVNTTGNVYYSL